MSHYIPISIVLIGLIIQMACLLYICRINAKLSQRFSRLIEAARPEAMISDKSSARQGYIKTGKPNPAELMTVIVRYPNGNEIHMNGKGRYRPQISGATIDYIGDKVVKDADGNEREFIESTDGKTFLKDLGREPRRTRVKGRFPRTEQSQ